MSHTTAEHRVPLPADASRTWYPTGRNALSGEWDGSAWTGRSRPDAEGTTPPKWRTRFLPFIGHSWFWMLTGGLATTAGSAAAGQVQALPAPVWLALATIGVTLAMTSMVALVWRLLRFGELAHLRLIIVAGVVAGAVSFGIGQLIEPVLWPALGMPFAADLWLSGPVEETAKMLVPLLLLVFSRRLFGNPRAGVLMVLISGGVFGATEAFTYLRAATGANELLLTGFIRASAELTHGIWPAIGAALIWLAAHRAGRVVTVTGIIGYLIPVVVHSLHDGLAAGTVSGTENTVGQANLDTSQVIAHAVFGNVFILAVLALSVVLLRNVARELVPPTAIVTNPPRWRPRLKQWGLSVRARSAAMQPSAGLSSAEAPLTDGEAALDHAVGGAFIQRMHGRAIYLDPPQS